MTQPITDQQLTPVVVQVTVRVPLETAFHAFTHDFDRWWPMASHHIGTGDPVVAVLEPGVGGRWFERAADGAECTWGEVTAWDPPHHLQLAWGLDGTYTYRPGLENASRVDVRFSAVEPRVTHVVLTHHGFEAHAATASAVHDSVGSEGGWPVLASLFTTYAQTLG